MGARTRGASDCLSTAEALGPLLEAVPELTDVVEDTSGVPRMRLLRRVRELLPGRSGDLASAPGVGRVHLGPLSPSGARRLVEEAGSPLDAEALHRTTDGNPFFATEVLAAGTRELPDSVRDAVLARVSRLPRAARRVLEILDRIGAPAARRALMRDRPASGSPSRAAHGRPAGATPPC